MRRARSGQHWKMHWETGIQAMTNVTAALQECSDMLATLDLEAEFSELDTERIVRDAVRYWTNPHLPNNDRVGWAAAHLMFADDVRGALVAFLAAIVETRG